jgi:hypothetical protein
MVFGFLGHPVYWNPTANFYVYRNYSNKRRDVYYIFGAQGAAFIRGRRLLQIL